MRFTLMISSINLVRKKQETIPVLLFQQAYMKLLKYRGMRLIYTHVQLLQLNTQLNRVKRPI
jgi:hypothetical protein